MPICRGKLIQLQTFILCLSLAGASFGLTLNLKNGADLEGKLIERFNNQVTMENKGIRTTVPVSRVNDPETTWMKEAQDAFDKEDYATCQDCCKQIMIWNPESAEAQNLLKQAAVGSKNRVTKLEAERIAKEQEEAAQKALEAQKKLEAATSISSTSSKQTTAHNNGSAIDINTILTNIQNTYTAIDAFKMSTKVKISTNILGMRETSENIVSMESIPSKKLFKYNNSNSAMHSDGKNIYLLSQAKKQYIQFSIAEALSQDPNNELSELMDALGPIATITKSKNPAFLREETLTVNNQPHDCYVIRIDADPNPSKSLINGPIIYWVDKNTWYILKKQASKGTKDGKMTTEQTTFVNNFDPHPQFAANHFNFSPPSGYQFVDMKKIQDSLQKSEEANFTGKQAPDFTLKAINYNGSYNLKSLRGKVVLIDFFASWCPPSRKELPSIEKLHKEFAPKGLVVLGINNEKRSVIDDFRGKMGLTFPILDNTQNTVSSSYQVTGIPTTLVVGKDGVVVAHFVGSVSEQNLRDALAKAGIR